MATAPNCDLPPSYSTLCLSSVDEPIVEHVAPPLEIGTGKSFQDKDVRIMFTQKVLSIFLLQSVAIGIVLGIFAYYRIIIGHELIGVAVLLLVLTMIVMACIDVITERRKKYNCIILVYYPSCVTFVIVMIPTLFDVDLQAKLRERFFIAWMAYTLSGIAVLFYCIFSLDCNREFKLIEKMMIANAVFCISYLGLYLPYFMHNKGFDPSFAIVLYAYLLYVLYDISVMTSGNYRSPLTPADFVTGAVNLQIDFLFIISNFIHRKCCCGTVE